MGRGPKSSRQPQNFKWSTLAHTCSAQEPTGIAFYTLLCPLKLKDILRFFEKTLHSSNSQTHSRLTPSTD